MKTLSAEDINQLHQSIAEYDYRTIARGKRYYEQGRAKIEILSEGVVAGSVSGSGLYLVELRRSANGAWTSNCTCPIGSRCKHAYALSLAAINARSIDQSSHVEETAAKMLGRKPNRQEHAYLRRIKEAWQRYQIAGIVTESEIDLLRNQDSYYRNHGRQDLIETYMLEPAQDAFDLLGYAMIYCSLNDKHIPPLARKLVDLDTYMARVKTALRQHEIELWKQTLSNHTNGNAAVTETNAKEASIEIALVLGASKWEFKYRETGGSFENASSSTIREFQTVHQDRLSFQAIALLSVGNDFFDNWTGKKTSSRNQSARGLLYLMLKNHQLRKCILTPTYQPIEYSAEPLIWKTTKTKRQEQDYAKLQLALPNGEPVSDDALCISAHDQLVYSYRSYERGQSESPDEPPYYIIDGTVHRGPERLTEQTSIDIPWESLASEAGIRFLNAKSSPIPAELQNNIEVVAPTLLLSGRTSEIPSSWGRTRGAIFDLEALSPQKEPLYHYTDQGWEFPPKTDADRSSTAERIRITDPKALIDLRSHFLASDFNWDTYTNTWKCSLKGTAEFQNLANWIDRTPKEVTIKLSPDLADLNAPPIAISYEIETQESDSVDWFDVKLVRKVDDALLTEKEIQLLLDAPGKLVQLPSGKWARSELSQTPETEQLAKEIGLNSENASQRLHALQLTRQTENEAIPENARAKLVERLRSLRSIRKANPPKALESTLRHYQTEGFHFLSFLSKLNLGGILADDMGLGKTLQALAWLSWLKRSSKKGKAFRAIIVCPKSVTDNWVHESEKFSTGLDAICFQPKRHTKFPPVNLIVANYTQLRLKADLFEAQSWDAAILDEGQYIKNPSSQTARVACSLKAAHRLVLTGTPIENRALDLWSLMRFAMPGLLGSQAAFTRNYNDKTDPQALPRLARRIQPFLLRRTKGQVASDLPDRIEEELHCELEPAQAKLYKAELKKAQQSLLEVKNKRQFDKSRFNILQSLMRLRQICCDPRLLGVKTKKGYLSSKTQALLDIIEPLQEEGHKILIFSQFVSMLEILESTLAERSIPYLTLTGKTQNRKELVERFQKPETETVFLLSLKAAGSGLNLTAASYVALFDPWWNPAVEAQAIDRTHRIGQTSKVIAYRLIAKNTIEDKIRALQKRKSDLANAIIDEEALSTVLSLDDIKYILSESDQT